MKNWLPENYEVPQPKGNYMKFEKGDNVFRVLSSPVIGYEYWNKDNKPVRLHSYPETFPADARIDENGRAAIKHFWAFIVWNYKASKIQMLEITQASIQGALSNLVSDVDWGDPKGYDIKVTRVGEKLDTEYTVNPKPHLPIKPEINIEFSNTNYDLDNLFRGEDVFDVKNSDGSPIPNF